VPSYKTASTVHALHDYLLSLEGDMPTLRDLAQKFGESPQCLNRNFVREYGQTIYATVINHRLTQAHRALLGSGVPIKTIAARVGYSHVNHFTHAFKSKFGYTPGSLRRTA
jgi:AraC-like DNA-binding protein